MEIEALLKKCIIRNRAAWEEFTRLYTGLIKRSVIYKVHNLGIFLSKTDISDIVQEIFLSIWEKNKLAKIKKAASLEGWLVMISINITSNYCRKNIFYKDKNTISLDASIEGAKTTLNDIIPDNKTSVEEIIVSNELREVIDNEISRLKTREQLAVKFHLYDGEKQKDIAKIMNLPMSTVGTILSRAKKKIKRRLEKKWDF